MRQESDILLAEKNELMESSQHISAEIRRLFSLATFITLEAGMTNDFSDGLEEVIEKLYGELAHSRNPEDIVLIIEEAVPFTIAAETLRYIGNIESNRFIPERRNLLEACLLQSRFMLVRDGAAAGLSYIEDPKSINSVLTTGSYRTRVTYRPKE